MGLWIVLASVAATGPESRLIDVASESLASGDRPAAERALRRWASLTGATQPPQRLVELTSSLTDVGTFRLFGSRLEDRVRVALQDPEGLVGRLVVTVGEGEQTRQLTPLDDHASGRLEFGGAAIPAGATITITAWMIEPGPPAVIRRIVLDAERVPPPAPSGARALDTAGPTDDAEVATWQWWWIGAGVVAAALTGAAIWQESR